MSTCRECAVELTDDNWYPSKKKGNSRICTLCMSRYTQKREDAGYYQLRRERMAHRYSILAQERGECADHVSNFGVRLMYSPELRATFQWDHRFGPKSFPLSISSFTRSMPVLRAEVEKCAFICGNCHLLATQRSHFMEDKPDWLVHRRTTRREYDATQSRG